MRHYRQYVIKISLPGYDYLISYTFDKKWHAIVQSMDRDDIRDFTYRSPRCVKKYFKKLTGSKITTHWRTVIPFQGEPTNISLDW